MKLNVVIVIVLKVFFLYVVWFFILIVLLWMYILLKFVYDILWKKEDYKLVFKNKIKVKF